MATHAAEVHGFIQEVIVLSMSLPFHMVLIQVVHFMHHLIGHRLRHLKHIQIKQLFLQALWEMCIITGVVMEIMVVLIER